MLHWEECKILLWGESSLFIYLFVFILVSKKCSEWRDGDIWSMKNMYLYKHAHWFRYFKSLVQHENDLDNFSWTIELNWAYIYAIHPYIESHNCTFRKKNETKIQLFIHKGVNMWKKKKSLVKEIIFGKRILEKGDVKCEISK